MAEIHPPPGRTDRSTDRAMRRTLIGMAGTAAVVVVGLGSLSIAGGGEPDERPTRPLGAVAAPTDERDLVADAGSVAGADDPRPTVTQPAVEVPPGLEPVAGDRGQIVGYLRVEDERRVLEEGEPPLQLGSSDVAFRGLEVVDADGAQVGWFLSGDLGFVALEEVADPEQLAAIEATWLADQADAAAPADPDAGAEAGVDAEVPAGTEPESSAELPAG